MVEKSKEWLVNVPSSDSVNRPEEWEGCENGGKE